jgi:hypothetical protein
MLETSPTTSIVQRTCLPVRVWPTHLNKHVLIVMKHLHLVDTINIQLCCLLCSPLGKLGGSKGTWGEAPPPTVVTSELWGAPMGKSRGPPPGLSNKNAPGNAGAGGAVSSGGGGNSSNGWSNAAVSGGGASGVAGSAAGGSGRSSSWGIQGSAAATWGSTWLLLKNLTPQVKIMKWLCFHVAPPPPKHFPVMCDVRVSVQTSF